MPKSRETQFVAACACCVCNDATEMLSVGEQDQIQDQGRVKSGCLVRPGKDSSFFHGSAFLVSRAFDGTTLEASARRGTETGHSIPFACSVRANITECVD
jgi:hypothetical protein